MKKQIRLSLVVVMMLSFIINVLPVQVADAAVNYVTATRSTSENTLYLKGDKESEIGLTIKGTPPVNIVKPNDIMLLLDKSSSMKDDNRFDEMKKSASEFLDLVDFANHEVGIVDYSSAHLTSNKSLSTNKADLKNYISKLSVGGGTLTNDAIRYAMKEFQTNGREDAQPVIILLTDGQASNTPDALLAAKEAKDAGIVFYTIALLGPAENPDTSRPNQLMKDMATTAHHHHFVLGSVGLIDIYRAIVKEIGVASAYDVKITEQIAPEFEVVKGSYDSNIPKPTYDKDTNTLTWSMQELKDQALNLGYKVKVKDGVETGTYKVAASSVITYKDYTGKSCSYTVPNKSIEVKNLPLTVESITEPKAKIAGGEKVTIKGTNFRNGATVKFNSTLATDVVVVDSKTITATVPAGKQGSAKVTVTNDDKSSGTLDFYYEGEPEVTSLTPNTGKYEGGTTVKINGNNFLSDIKVYFGTEEVKNIKWYNNTYVIVQTPQATQAGAVDVTLVNGDGTTTVLKDAFTYDAKIVEVPEINSISPNSGLEAGGESVTITGKNFKTDMTVTFGGQEASITKQTDTSVTVKAPAGTKGKVDVKITNPDGESVTITEGYEYIEEVVITDPAPEIKTISQTSGLETGGDLVYIEGANFKNGLTVTIGGKDAKVANIYSSSKIRIKIPEGTPGKADVELTNPDGQSDVLKEGYEYIEKPADPAPEITSLSVTECNENGSVLSYIEGANFKSGLTVYYGDKEATVSNYYSSSKIRVKIPANSPGLVDVKIVNPDGQSCTAPEQFEYTEVQPEITSLSVTSGELAGGELIYINGNNFENGLTVKFGDKEAVVSNYYSSSKIRVKAPSSEKSGSVDITIEVPSGKTCTLADGYTYNEAPKVPAPTLDVISKTSVASGSVVESKANVYLYLLGSDFKSGLTVNIYDSSDNLVLEGIKLSNYYTSGKARFKIPTSVTAGSYKICVANTDGQESEKIDFEVL